MDGYRTVKELTDEEIAELKEAYYEMLHETGDDDADYFSCAEEIPNGIIYGYYADFFFTEDDFFCNFRLPF